MRARRVGHVDGAERARALVHHVGDDRRQALLVGRIGAGSALDLQHKRDDRHARGARPSAPRARWAAVPHDRGKRERRIRSDVGKPRSIDAPSRHRDRFGAGQRERRLAAGDHAQDDARVATQVPARRRRGPLSCVARR